MPVAASAAATLGLPPCPPPCGSVSARAAASASGRSITVRRVDVGVAVTVALRFGYDGHAFPSYARDPNQPNSIEGHLVAALEAEGLVSFTTGSRTDAGVSAVANVCAARLERPHTVGLLAALRSSLPVGIWPLAVAHVPEDWNPRHAASRHYVYWSPAGHDLAAAADACRRFLGRHDMRAFARVEPGRDPMRQVDRFDVRPEGDSWRFDVEGPSFLWNQVRRMVGATLAVAQGRARAADIDEALADGRPRDPFLVAPAETLALWDVKYPGLEWEVRPWTRLRRQVDMARLRAAVAKAVAERVEDG